jgi:hypothetical protein
MVAYFIQNLAVFDSLVTYMGLMITLGYIYWLTAEEKKCLPMRLGLTVNFMFCLAPNRPHVRPLLI